MSRVFYWVIPVGSASAVWPSYSVINQKESLSVSVRLHDVVWLDITVDDTVAMYVHQSGELKKRAINSMVSRASIRTISLAMRNTVLQGNPFDPCCKSPTHVPRSSIDKYSKCSSRPCAYTSGIEGWPFSN